MTYQRPANPATLSKEQKLVLMKDYVAHYEREASLDREVLNRKVPREAFAPLLDRIGDFLLSEANRLASEPGVLSDFLTANPLPASIEQLLPREFRVFCLALNALKQWVSAEQNATDRYLLGGVARDLCRAAGTTCIVTGEDLGTDIELHYPVRDGRPPLPLSRRGHDTVEGQLSTASEDPIQAALVKLKREGNRSWAMLRRGCLDLLGTPIQATSAASASNARTFARKASEASNLDFSQLLSWLDQRGY